MAESRSKNLPRDTGRKVRVTVDLDGNDYEALREWAFHAHMSHADVLRALVRRLVDDDRTGRWVLRQGES